MAGRADLSRQKLSDLQLQLGVGLLQGVHLGQVGGQTVVQVLHGEFPVANDCLGSSATSGQAETATSTPASGEPEPCATATACSKSAGDANSGSSCTTVDTTIISPFTLP